MLRPARAALPLWPLLLAACGPSAPAAVTTAGVEVMPRVAERCRSWPLEHGCVTGLAAGPEMVCAIAGERTFCWGPGATAREPRHGEVLVLSPSERTAVGVVGDGSAGAGAASCRPGDEPNLILQCNGENHGAYFFLPVAPELGLRSGSDLEKLVTGHDHACALVHGSVLCVGGRYTTARGARRAPHADTRAETRPNRVAIDGATDLVALEATTCALADGDVTCWGDGLYFPPQALPTPPRTLSIAVAHGTGGALDCFLAETGALYCGVMEDFQQVPSLRGVKQIVEGLNGDVCARLDDGRVACLDGDGKLTERPFLAPAKDLVRGLPCALGTDEKVRCEAWSSIVDIDANVHEFPAGVVPGLGVPRGVADARTFGPGACAITDRGDVACWGMTGFDRQKRDFGRSGERFVQYSHADDTPVRLAGPKDVVELAGGGCLRTRDGAVWLVAASAPRSPRVVRSAARTAAGADHAVALEHGEGCVARRADGTAFELAQTIESVGEEPRPVAAPFVRPVDGTGSENLGVGAGARVFELGLSLACARRPDAGLACRRRELDGWRGPVFDPLRRSTLPVRVIPPTPR